MSSAPFGSLCARIDEHRAFSHQTLATPPLPGPASLMHAGNLQGAVTSTAIKIVKEYFGDQPPHPQDLRRAHVAEYSGTSTDGRTYRGSAFLHGVPLHIDHGTFVLTAPVCLRLPEQLELSAASVPG